VKNPYKTPILPSSCPHIDGDWIFLYTNVPTSERSQPIIFSVWTLLSTLDCFDIDEWEAEYRLIAENSERRGESETDPVKKGRQAAFLKEYWGVRDGSAGKRSLDGQNVHLKDVAETIGETQRTTQRLIKLNELIPMWKIFHRVIADSIA
jgi:ParB family chromosome partitioning protein